LATKETPICALLANFLVQNLAYDAKEATRWPSQSPDLNPPETACQNSAGRMKNLN
jgi:hypothetical protein